MRPVVVLGILVCGIVGGCSTIGGSAGVLQPPMAVAPHAAEPPKILEKEQVVLEQSEPILQTKEGAPTISDPKSNPEVVAPLVPDPVKLVSGNPFAKKIALTIDDGPHKGYTDQLVRILKEMGVKATFFMIGRNVDLTPELAKLCQESGIEIANHTYTHSRLATLTDDAIKQELVKGADAIEKATGSRPQFFRPPGGEYDDRVIKIARELGLTMVLWTCDAGDFTTIAGNPSEETIKRKVLSRVTPGAIIIMHDPMPGSLQALPSIITTLRAMGYEFVTVSELAQDPKAIRFGGPRIKPNVKASVQALVNEARYPLPKSPEDQNANSEQGTEGTAPPQGKEGQGTDQGSQGGSKGFEGNEIKPQTRESR